MSKISLKTSLRFMMLEMIITNTLLAMPIMVPFYHSIGMNQGQIGLSQSICGIAMVLLNIQTGWIADRFSRKACNAFGDIGCAISLLIYSQATNFAGVVLGEFLFGATISFSNGADDGLVKGHVVKIDDGTGNLLHHFYSKVAIWKPIAQVIALLAGGLIGAAHPRIAIAISGIPFLIGGILSLFIREEGERRDSKGRSAFKDMAKICKDTILPNPELRWLIFANAVGIKITGVMIWALTPLLIAAGIPVKVVGISWVINSLAVVVGAWLAKRYALRLTKWQRFAIPAVLTIFALMIMSIHLSVFTVCLYVILGADFGWNCAVMKPMMQDLIPMDSQSTAMSLIDTLSRLFYIPLVWVVGIAGNSNIRLSMVATIMIFLPLVILITIKLRHLEK